jgi:hypothetical protein
VTSSRAPDQRAAGRTVQTRAMVRQSLAQPSGSLPIIRRSLTAPIPNNKLAQLGECPLMLARSRL